MSTLTLRDGRVFTAANAHLFGWIHADDIADQISPTMYTFFKLLDVTKDQLDDMSATLQAMIDVDKAEKKKKKTVEATKETSVKHKPMSAKKKNGSGRAVAGKRKRSADKSVDVPSKAKKTTEGSE